MFKKISIFLSAILVISAFVTPAFAATNTVVVTGNTSSGENHPGWMFNRDVSTSTPFEFNTDAASVGLGSLYVLPIGSNPSDKFIAEDFINTPISLVNSVSYDFKIGSHGLSTQEEQFYMNVYANFGLSPDDKYYDCRYDIVPTAGSTSSFTTVTFDPTQSYPVTKSGSSPFNCPDIPADMDSSSANSTIRVFAINVGDTNVSDMGLDGYLDKVVVDIGPDQTTYDFEPSLTPSHRDDCRNGGWQTFNNPTFRNQGRCIDYVNHHNHRVRGNNDQYPAYGLNRRADFEMDTASNRGHLHYSDGNKMRYRVKVSEVKVVGNTAWFAGQVTWSKNNTYTGQWLFAKVVDNGTSGDQIWGSFVADEATAKADVAGMNNPADGAFVLFKGNIKVN